MCNLFDKSAKRDLMRAKMRLVVEQVLCTVEQHAAEVLESDWSNYERQVRQEFSNQAQNFAGRE